MPRKEQPRNEAAQNFINVATSYVDELAVYDDQIARAKKEETRKRIEGINSFLQRYNHDHSLLTLLGNSYISPFLDGFETYNISKINGISLLSGKGSHKDSKEMTLVLTAEGFIFIDKRDTYIYASKINDFNDFNFILFDEGMIFGDISADKLQELLQSRFETIADQISKTPTPSTPHAVGIT